jgi:hypothetical protein
MTAETVTEQKSRKKSRAGYVVLTIIVVLVTAWITIRPGVFTVQPIGALPDGVTIIYHSRSSKMPFFSSPDGICLQTQGTVSLLCRGIALGASTDFIDRKIIRLPYIRWAYLQSTGGQEFEK